MPQASMTEGVSLATECLWKGHRPVSGVQPKVCNHVGDRGRVCCWGHGGAGHASSLARVGADGSGGQAADDSRVG